MRVESRRVSVLLPQCHYDIVIGSGILPSFSNFSAVPLKAAHKIVLLSDETVAPLYAAPLAKQLNDMGKQLLSITVPAGEGSKSFAVFERVLEQLLSWPIDRKTLLIAVGGGVIGDLGGFIASVALRGIPFIQVPTTLLAQVDSSVGGKTAINCKAGKNLIGSFYQPELVVIDTDCLETLPLRERRAGYAEIIKYGLLGDAAFFDWCVLHGQAVLDGEPQSLHHAIETSCRAKAAIVAADEKESGVRALLNLGHTFAHALEADVGFDNRLLHGEAVAFGLRLAARLSVQTSGLSAAASKQLETHLDALGYPRGLKDLVAGHKFVAQQLIEHMESDKKTLHGAKTFIVLDSIGAARELRGIPDSLVLSILEDA